MTGELELLWKLRELDEQLVQVHAALARFPAQRRDLDQKIEHERKHLEQLKTRLTDVQKRRRDRERDIEASTEQERKFQGQLVSVKKNEEYTALIHEIGALKAKRSDVETDVLLLLDEEDKIHQERPRVEQALHGAEREATERRATIDREEASEREREARLEAERSTQMEGLAAGTRARYERAHGTREGRAVVPILKGACGGCFRAQPPQILQEARRGDRVLSCEGCGRLIIWPPDGA